MKYLNFLRTYVCLLLGFAALTACTSEEDDALIPEGKGYVKLSLNADTGFQTKAVDESEYTKLDNYTVQIWQGETQIGEDRTYSDVKERLIVLERGSYTVKAFMGEDKPVSTTSMYVVGSKDVTIANKVEEVSFVCKPVCAKVKVEFDPAMDQYFENYWVDFTTEAMGETDYTWKKEYTLPCYMKVNEKEDVSVVINLVKKEGIKSETSIKKTYEMSPLMFKTIKLKPVLSNGSIGIEITVDESTNDKNVEIEVPSDWV